MSFNEFFQENRDDIQSAILTLHSLAAEDPSNAKVYRAAKEVFVALMQKSVWLVGFEEYQDGGAFKNAVFAAGYIVATVTLYRQVADSTDVNNLPMFSSKAQLLEKCLEEVSAFNNRLMNTSASISV